MSAPVKIGRGQQGSELKLLGLHLSSALIILLDRPSQFFTQLPKNSTRLPDPNPKLKKTHSEPVRIGYNDLVIPSARTGCLRMSSAYRERIAT
jgi:hypothetical protein